MSTRILYIEDDAIVDRLAKRRLENDGFVVTVSEDGETGLKLAQSGAFDIILLDHMLLNMSGLEILKALQPDPSAPVIIVSGSSELAIAVQAMKIGAADYVIKETDGSYLVLLPRTINRVLNHVRLIDDKKRADERIAEQAQTIQGVLDNMDPGITLFDTDLNLVSYNDRILELLELPMDFLEVVMPLIDILNCMAKNGDFNVEETEEAITTRFDLFKSGEAFALDHDRPTGRVIEVRGGPMPGGEFIATYPDITDRKRMEDELRSLAKTNPLTGVNNRRRYTESSERELTRCIRYEHPLCILMLDADHFKLINDTYGHEAGDLVLVALAKACIHEPRDIDVFGRFGGEEFTITLPETSIDIAMDVAERLRQLLSEIIVPLDDGSNVTLSFSIGVSQLMNNKETPSDILNRADAALYTAKERGRNQVVAA
jgi:two-component system cell cycle response regulator